MASTHALLRKIGLMKLDHNYPWTRQEFIDEHSLLPYDYQEQT
jgi:hypothetical protein